MFFSRTNNVENRYLRIIGKNYQLFVFSKVLVSVHIYQSSLISYSSLIILEKNARNDKSLVSVNGASFERVLLLADKRYVVTNKI